MKLSEFFTLLTYGELNNLKVGGKDVGGIYPKTSDEVLTYIRQGLTDLHSRFALKHNEVVIDLRDEVTSYLLTYDHAQSNTTTTADQWIADTPEKPFQEDIILIEEAFNEAGEELSVNKDNDLTGIFTPQYNVVHYLTPVLGNSLSILYKANHKKIDLSVDTPNNIELEIPYQLIRPLAIYVASMAHTAVGSPEGIQLGFTKMQEYEAACLQIEVFGTIHKESWINDRVGENGWV